MRSIVIAAACMLALASATAAAQAVKQQARDAAVERGRYLVKIGGCNDCHTVHYPQKAGKIPEAEWLTGSDEGFHGPWGTTYPANLRLVVNGMGEADWMTHARKPTRPPVPASQGLVAAGVGLVRCPPVCHSRAHSGCRSRSRASRRWTPGTARSRG